jgi:hypothetical protein
MFSKRYAQSSCVAFAFPLALTLSLPAVAGISKNVTQEDASEGRVAVAVAAEGGGTVIDFSETQETVKKVTLDDPSKVIVDYLAPLPVIRLFRGNIPLADIPSVKRTQLTVVTQDSDGQYRTYIFPVTPSAKPAVYTKFVVGGATSTKRSRDGTGVATTAFGIRQAERQQTLVDPLLKGRVRKYLQLTQAGMSDRQAAKRAGISMALVQRLDALGQGSTAIAQSLPAPNPSVLPVPVAPAPIGRSVAGSSLSKLEPPKAAWAPFPASNPAPKLPFQPQPESKQKQKPRLFEHGAQPSSPKGKDATPDQAVALNPAPNPLLSSAIAPPEAVRNRQLSASVRQKKTVSNQDYASALLRGLNKARLDGKIRYRSNQWYLVNGAIRMLKRGASLEKAISASGMHEESFKKLLSDGGIKS